MRVTTVWADADDGRAVRRAAVTREMIQDLPLDFELGCLPAGLDPPGDEVPGDLVSGIGHLRGREVAGLLLVVPGRLELLDQVTRRRDIDSKGTHQLDRPGVYPRDIRVSVAWRILHRHPLRPGHERADAGLELLPAPVDRLLLAGQSIE